MHVVLRENAIFISFSGKDRRVSFVKRADYGLADLVLRNSAYRLVQMIWLINVTRRMRLVIKIKGLVIL